MSWTRTIPSGRTAESCVGLTTAFVLDTVTYTVEPDEYRIAMANAVDDDDSGVDSDVDARGAGGVTAVGGSRKGASKALGKASAAALPAAGQPAKKKQRGGDSDSAADSEPESRGAGGAASADAGMNITVVDGRTYQTVTTRSGREVRRIIPSY